MISPEESVSGLNGWNEIGGRRKKDKRVGEIEATRVSNRGLHLEETQLGTSCFRTSDVYVPTPVCASTKYLTHFLFCFS